MVLVCSICWDSLEVAAPTPNDDFANLYEPPCGHIFHEKCLMDWIDTHAMQRFGKKLNELGLQIAMTLFLPCPFCTQTFQLGDVHRVYPTSDGDVNANAADPPAFDLGIYERLRRMFKGSGLYMLLFLGALISVFGILYATILRPFFEPKPQDWTTFFKEMLSWPFNWDWNPFKNHWRNWTRWTKERSEVLFDKVARLVTNDWI